MKQAAKDVMDLMLAGEQKFNDLGTAILYDKLVTEEYLEYKSAQSVAEEVDGLVDLIWVCIGKLHALGIDPCIAWEEVAASNRSKIDPVTGKCLKDSNGKIIKPEGYFKPNFKRLLS